MQFWLSNNLKMLENPTFYFHIDFLLLFPRDTWLRHRLAPRVGSGSYPVEGRAVEAGACGQEDAAARPSHGLSGHERRR